MKTFAGLLLASLVCSGCGSAATSHDDMSTVDAPDLANAATPDMVAPIDLATEADLAPASDLLAPPDLATSPPDMAFVPRPPSLVWLSSGGGSFIGPVSSSRVNLSLGGSCVFGRAPATGGASLSLGNLALNTD